MADMNFLDSIREFLGQGMRENSYTPPVNARERISNIPSDISRWFGNQISAGNPYPRLRQQQEEYLAANPQGSPRANPVTQIAADLGAPESFAQAPAPYRASAPSTAARTNAPVSRPFVSVDRAPSDDGGSPGGIQVPDISAMRTAYQGPLGGASIPAGNQGAGESWVDRYRKLMADVGPPPQAETAQPDERSIGRNVILPAALAMLQHSTTGMPFAGGVAAAGAAGLEGYNRAQSTAYTDAMRRYQHDESVASKMAELGIGEDRFNREQASAARGQDMTYQAHMAQVEAYLAHAKASGMQVIPTADGGRAVYDPYSNRIIQKFAGPPPQPVAAPGANDIARLDAIAKYLQANPGSLDTFNALHGVKQTGDAADKADPVVLKALELAGKQTELMTPDKAREQMPQIVKNFVDTARSMSRQAPGVPTQQKVVPPNHPIVQEALQRAGGNQQVALTVLRNAGIVVSNPQPQTPPPPQAFSYPAVMR